MPTRVTVSRDGSHRGPEPGIHSQEAEDTRQAVRERERERERRDRLRERERETERRERESLRRDTSPTALRCASSHTLSPCGAAPQALPSRPRLWPRGVRRLGTAARRYEGQSASRSEGEREGTERESKPQDHWRGRHGGWTEEDRRGQGR